MRDTGSESEDDWDEPPRIWFSWVEVLHLAASVIVLTVAFALVLGARKDCSGDALVCEEMISWRAMGTLLPYSAAAVVPAFILHELAHKVVAQRKDMWAEFRANAFGLTGGLVLTALLKVLLAIPGAVYIYGDASRRDSGVISIVGPIVNLVIGYSAFLLDALFPGVEVPEAGGLGIGSFFQLIVLLNALLAAFNMLPIGPLDGRKVWRWSPLAFFGMWALIVALALLVIKPALPA